MKKLITLLVLSTLITGCQNGEVNAIDSAPFSGTINQSDEKSEAVKKLAQGYQDGNFEIAREYFTPDGKHYFNNIEYTTDEIIDGYNFHSILYDDLKHVNPMITTMYYNNGEVYTNHWSDWSGTSKITGEVQKNTFHCWWQWEGDKIVSTKCYLDPTELFEEIALYQAQTAEEN